MLRISQNLKGRVKNREIRDPPSGEVAICAMKNGDFRRQSKQKRTSPKDKKAPIKITPKIKTNLKIKTILKLKTNLKMKMTK